MQILWSDLQTDMVPSIWEDVWKLWKDEPLQWGVQSSKSSMVHNVEKEADQEREIDIETVNIKSIRFNSNHSAIIANLKTSSNKIIITVLHKIYTGSDGNIIQFYMCKKYFLGQQ